MWQFVIDFIWEFFIELIVILLEIVSNFRREESLSKVQQHQRGGDGSTNIQSAGDIHLRLDKESDSTDIKKE